MTRKLKDKEIVGEAMYSVRRSLTVNIPPPPTNADGSFKSVDQMVNETRFQDSLKRKAAEDAYTAMVSAHEDEIRNDPEQVAWEREQRKTSRPPREKQETPFFVKLIIALAAFMLAGLTGNNIVLFVVGVAIFSWFVL